MTLCTFDIFDHIRLFKIVGREVLPNIVFHPSSSLSSTRLNCYCNLFRNISTVNHQRMTRNPRSILTSQEDSSSCNVIRQTQSPPRVSFFDGCGGVYCHLVVWILCETGYESRFGDYFIVIMTRLLELFVFKEGNVNANRLTSGTNRVAMNLVKSIIHRYSRKRGSALV